MDMTVIGDTVNLASRIEGLTRIYGCDILVDERIASKAMDTCLFLEVDVVRVKGRKKPERLFFPHRSEHAGWARESSTRRGRTIAQEILPQLLRPLNRLAQDGLAPALAAVYKIRCEAFVSQPLRKEWEGIWDFLEK